MSDVLTQRRPAAVTVLAILILLDAAFNIVFGAYLMIMSPNAASFGSITDHTGTALSFSPFLLFINGLISFIFGFMLVWLFRITLVGSATAGALINFLAIIDIIFALFRLPFGWGTIVLMAIVLILANTSRSKAWFSQTA